MESTLTTPNTSRPNDVNPCKFLSRRVSRTHQVDLLYFKAPPSDSTLDTQPRDSRVPCTTPWGCPDPAPHAPPPTTRSPIPSPQSRPPRSTLHNISPSPTPPPGQVQLAFPLPSYPDPRTLTRGSKLSPGPGENGPRCRRLRSGETW